MFAPAAAQAARGLYIWQGGDYSYDYKLERRIQIHDGESDGRNVKVQYATGASDTRHELINKSGRTPTRSGRCSTGRTSIDRWRSSTSVRMPTGPGGTRADRPACPLKEYPLHA